MACGPINNLQASSIGSPAHSPVPIDATAVIHCPATIGGSRPTLSARRENGTFNSSRENAELDRIRPTPDGPRPMSAAKMGSTGITQPKPTLLTNCEPVNSAAALYVVAAIGKASAQSPVFS